MANPIAPDLEREVIELRQFIADLYYDMATVKTYSSTRRMWEAHTDIEMRLYQFYHQRKLPLPTQVTTFAEKDSKPSEETS